MLSNIKNNYQQFQDDQNKVEEDREALLQEKQQLESDRKKFSEDIADAKKADFKAYFELIDKETAQQLYEEILQAEKADKETKEYVSFYENMDAENAAKIFDEMVASKMDLIVKIFKYMNKEQAAEILASMDTGNAAKVSDILSKEYPIGLPKD
jgi:flagellar motility protein MotE (MotC chaperone)